MEEVEDRYDDAAADKADNVATQRNHFLIFLPEFLEAAEIVGTEVELVRDVYIVAVFYLGYHLGAAGHQIALGEIVALVCKLDCHLSGEEVVRAVDDGREELLLEVHPADFRRYILGRIVVTPCGQGLRFLLAVEIVGEIGVLLLVLVPLLEARYYHCPVEIDAGYLRRDHVLQSDEGQVVLQEIGIRGKGVFLLDIATIVEVESHRDAAVRLLGEFEGQVCGIDHLSGIHGYAQVALAFTYEHKACGILACRGILAGTVGGVALHAYGVRLGTLGIEHHFQLFVFNLAQGRGLCPRHIEGRILVYFLYCRLFRLFCGLFFGLFGKRLSLGGLFRNRLCLDGIRSRVYAVLHRFRVLGDIFYSGL